MWAGVMSMRFPFALMPYGSKWVIINIGIVASSGYAPFGRLRGPVSRSRRSLTNLQHSQTKPQRHRAGERISEAPLSTRRPSLHRHSLRYQDIFVSALHKRPAAKTLEHPHT